MSASQRLKALKELQDRNPHVYILNDSLLRAYPQILALVEAAEKEWEGDFASGEVGDALAALDEALS
jgi:hypothetical protein